MQTQSADLKRALVAGRQWPVSIVEVIPGGAGPADAALATLDVDGGSVANDESRASRRSATGLTCTDNTGSLTPGVVGDLLHPATGNELRIRSGRRWTSPSSVTFDPITRAPIVVPGQVLTEYNAAGVFRFDKLPIVDDQASVRMTVAGLDRAFAISRSRWTDAFRLPRQTLLLDAIRRILADRWTGARPLVFDASACTDHDILEMTTPNAILGTDQTNTDPWADCVTLATAGGCELFVNEVGTVVIRPFVDPLTAPQVATFTEGADCTVTNVSREIDPTRTFSGIVVTGGAGKDKACRAVVWNTNPASPTYVGKVGYIPAFYDSPLLRTIGQCYLVGEGLLHRLQLSSEVLTVTAVPNPGFEAADAVFFSRKRLEATGVYGLSSFDLPLDPTATMTVVTRSTSDIPDVAAGAIT